MIDPKKFHATAVRLSGGGEYLESTQSTAESAAAAAEGHYSQAVFSAVDAVMSEPHVAANLSAPTRACVGALQVAAFEVVEGIRNDVSANDIVTQMMMQLSAQVAQEVLKEIAGAVPLVGAIFDIFLSVGDAIIGGQEAERARKAEEARRICAEEAALFGVGTMGTGGGGTGPGGVLTPADYFVQTERLNDGSIVDTGRMPAIGTLLGIGFETVWPEWLFGTQHQSCAWGVPPEYWPGTKEHPSFETCVAAAKANGSLKCIGVFEEPFPTQNHNSWWLPMLGQIRHPIRLLREAITAQHPVRRRAAGLPPGDGGQTLWPIYMDLLHWLGMGSRYPTDGLGCPKQVPILSRDMFDRLYGPYGDIARRYEVRRNDPKDWVNHWSGMSAISYPDRSWMVRFLDGCQRDPRVDYTAWVYNMIGSWDLTVRPQNQPDIDRQNREVAQTLLMASDLTKKRLAELGLGGGRSTRDLSRDQLTKRLIDTGFMPRALVAKAGELSTGSKLALALGGAGLAAGGLWWLKKRGQR